MPFVEEFELLEYKFLPDGKSDAGSGKDAERRDGMLTCVRQGASHCEPNVNRW